MQIGIKYAGQMSADVKMGQSSKTGRSQLLWLFSGNVPQANDPI